MGLEARLIPLSDSKSWNQALDNVNHTYAHTHWYNQAMHIASQRDIYLFHASDVSASTTDTFEIICPISPRRKQAADCYDITTPYGFSGFAFKGQCAAFQTTWLAYMQAQGFVCGHIALSPFMHDKDVITDHFAGKRTYILDLAQSTDTIFKKMAHGHRYEIKKWLNEQHKISLIKNDAAINSFIKLQAEFVQRKNAAKIYHFNEASWHKLFSNPEVSLFSISRDGHLESAAVFITHQDTVDYFMAISTPEGRYHSRGILWEAICHFAKQNHRWLHLGGGVRPDDDLEKFKARFGGEAKTTFALKQIYNLEAYSGLCSKYQVAESDLDSYFPPYWRTQ